MTFYQKDPSTATPECVKSKTKLTNKPHLVTFHESILVSLSTFQSTLVFQKNIYINVRIVIFSFHLLTIINILLRRKTYKICKKRIDVISVVVFSKVKEQKETIPVFNFNFFFF